ncbi:unnamed protein product [Cylicostephanus goldi]|uniref:Piwi domain-containing protein n=1 Tax=Cylicostephanus goldi TaxID=71465 RepID=A0A3P6RQA7_CYLGO|nr:unnamed protein product [Cylicostephanus goldi]
MNLKLREFDYAIVPESFAHNRWIAGGAALVLGYDVSHPAKQTREEILNRIPPQKSSVVGFSFKGSTHFEYFIGDYHFQNPSREKVESAVLNARNEVDAESVLPTSRGMTKRNCNYQRWCIRGTVPNGNISTSFSCESGMVSIVQLVEEELGAIKEAVKSSACYMVKTRGCHFSQS